MRKKTALCLLILPCLLFCFGSCSLFIRKPSHPVTWYTLEYATPTPDARKKADALVMVEGFATDPVYNTRQMIYSDGAFVRNAYPYRRWRANPGDMVAYFLARDAKASGLFNAALPLDSGISETHILEGTVEEYYEKDLPGKWQAVLAVSITLARAKDPDVTTRILFQKQYRETTDADSKNPQAVARAMSQAMSRVSTRVLADVHGALMEDAAKEK